ncbi:MAG: UDP-N-acetylmuramate dehydrogenase [Clostridia bacterium]|nr:UDP-N-acetylmuramate dehydrogenase [Clostridia bacterium]
MKREIIDFLKMNDVEYKTNYKLSLDSPIRIGGWASVLALPDSCEKLIKLIKFLNKSKFKYKLLGRMSNVLPPDEDYHGVIIRTDRICDFEICGNQIKAFCGCSLSRISSNLCPVGLSGFEGLSGIPGSIGASVVGNAGAFGRQISDLLSYVCVYLADEDTTVVLSADDCRLSYRRSYLSQINCAVLYAVFSLKNTDSSLIKDEMDRCRLLRKSTQPVGYPSLGSTFKRPSEDCSAARLVDECGLKGYTVGGAQISTKHAGFILNIGGATAKDYITLSNYAAECVYSKHGVRLEREVEIL